MLQCTEGVRSGCSCRLTVKCVPQVSMRTPRGVGMPRAKKKKAAVQEEAGLSCAEPDPAVLMPPPPPRPPKPAATQAPAKDPDFEARQFAGRVLQLAIKQHKAREREFARSEKRVAAAVEKNDDMGAKIDRLQRKKPRDAEKELKLLLKAEQYINKELMLHAQDMPRTYVCCIFRREHDAQVPNRGERPPNLPSLAEAKKWGVSESE